MLTFKKKFIFTWFEIQKNREKASNYWFLLQIPKTAWLRPDWCQKPGTQSGCHTAVQRTKSTWTITCYLPEYILARNQSTSGMSPAILEWDLGILSDFSLSDSTTAASMLISEDTLSTDEKPQCRSPQESTQGHRWAITIPCQLF